MLAAKVSPFDGAAYLTVSFAPDGTEVTGQPSQLSAELNQIAPESEWRTTILSAFQEWAQHTNADVGLVGDEGLPFGVPGLTTRDPRFGDIRIGAIAMDSQVAAISVSHDQPVAGTWAGDVLINTAADITSLDQLRSVMLHEAGHVFGVDHSDDPDSIMHVHGGGGVTSLDSHDIAHMIELHGQRSEDLFEKRNGGPTELEFEDGEDEDVEGFFPSLVYGDITTHDDVDLYKIEIEDDYSGSVTFRFRVDGISQLKSEVTIVDKNDSILASGKPAANGRLNLTLPAVADESVFIQIEADPQAPTEMQIGGYSLVTTLDDGLLSDAATMEMISDGRLRRLKPDDLEDLFESDGSESPLIEATDQNNSFSEATALTTFGGFDEGSHFNKLTSIQSPGDHDFFAFETSHPTDDVVTIHVRPTEIDTLIPNLRLYDEDGDVVESRVLASGAGVLTVQASIRPRGEWVVEVFSDSTDPRHSTGNYELSVTTGDVLTALDTNAEVSLSSAVPQQTARLFVAKDHFFHFVATNDSTADGSTAIVRIVDDIGNERIQLAMGPGEIRSGTTTHLSPGEYRVVVDGIFGQPAQTANVTLESAVISTLLSVPVDDPTDDAQYQCAAAMEAFCFPDGTQSTEPFGLSLFDSSTSYAPTLRSPLEPETWWSPTFTTAQTGDVNLDGTVNSVDLGILLNNFAETTDLSWSVGNLNDDAEIDSSDLGLLLNQFSPNTQATVASLPVMQLADERVDISPVQIVRITNYLTGDASNRDYQSALDTNNDGTVSPIDALMLINRLNKVPANMLPPTKSSVAIRTDAIDVVFSDVNWWKSEGFGEEKDRSGRLYRKRMAVSWS